MGFPQFILIVLIAFDLGAGFAKHGQEKTGKHNVWVDLTGSALLLGLLFWGGFFE